MFVTHNDNPSCQMYKKASPNKACFSTQEVLSALKPSHHYPRAMPCKRCAYRNKKAAMAAPATPRPLAT